ncbi:MAG: hypothetical protein K0S61_710 [Anaerocolumna sp.]|jgi:hypothetical protein|nr:hypothetical protein [Anaerocolumna sp.]
MDKPKLLIKEDGSYFLTDGEINGFKIIVRKQPSREIMDNTLKRIYEKALRN